MKKIICLLLSVLAAAYLLTGCGAHSIAERRTDTSSTLYVGYVGSSFPTSFMPWLSREGIAPTIAAMVYNTLFTYNDETGDFDPLLGKRWCYVDLEGTPLTLDGTYETANDYAAVEAYYNSRPEDYMVVRLELFDDIVWQDGEKMTVEDVYYSFDVATDNALSNHAGALAWTADLQHESRNGTLVKQGIFTAQHPDLSGTFPIREGEEDTVCYLIVNKVYGAVTTLFQTILILPAHIWQPLVSETQQLNNKNPEGEFLEQYEHPVGCGPWQIVDGETNAQMITLARNPDYHLKDEDGSPLYKVDKIRFLLYLSDNTAIFALRKGYIDILDSAISSNYVGLMEQEEDIQICRSAGSGISCLVLNVNPAPPFDTGRRLLLRDADFRKALALAIDQQELVDKVLDGAGETASAGLIAGDDALLYEPAADFLPASMEERLRQANAILDTKFPQKDADGYRVDEDGRLSFEVLASPGAQDLISWLQRQFQKIGIELVYKAAGSSPETTYLFRGDFDMTIQGVILSMANADVMYRSHFVTTERSSNYGKFQDADMTDTIEAMRLSLNRDAKIAMIKDLEIQIAESCYKLPLYRSEVLSAARCDRFTGYVETEGGTAFNNETLKHLERVDKT